MAYQTKVDILGIIDHDSTAAFAEVVKTGRLYQVGIISGVELQLSTVPSTSTYYPIL